MLCVHIGPGRLGLGLVVEQLLQAGFEVCLVGRAGGSAAEATQFGLSFVDPDVGLVYRDVDWATTAERVDDLPDAVLQRIASSEPLLITAALGTEAPARGDFIAGIAELRAPEAETLLIPCENGPDPVYRELGVRIEVADCVVDRICAWPRSGARDRRGRRVVEVHPVGEWVVASESARSAVLSRLSSAPLVRIVPPPLAGWKARKLWCVNGVHLALALVARLEGVDDLPLVREHRAAFLAIAQPMLRQIVAAVHAGWPDVELDRAYADDRIRAFTESRDTTSRLLERHLVRADLRPFMERLDARVGRAAEAARRARGELAAFDDLMALVVSVLADPDLYYPDPRPLDEGVDDEVVDRFAAILDRWMERRRADALVSDLRRALRAQRDLLGPGASQS